MGSYPRTVLLRLAGVVMALAVAGSSALAPIARGGEAEMERVRREYPEACRKLALSYQQMRGRGIMTTRQKNDPVWTSTFEFAVQGDDRKVDFVKKKQPGVKEGIQSVFCRRRDTAFSLQRGIDVPDAPFQIKGAGGGRVDLSYYGTYFGLFQTFPFGNTVSPCYSDSIDGARFKLVAAEPIAFDGRACLDLRFEPVSSMDITRWHLVVDPDLGWAAWLLEAYDGPEGDRSGTRMEYAPAIDGVPIPRLAKLRSKHLKREQTCEFQSVSLDPTPAEAFSMTYYGLPEIGGRPYRISGTLGLFALGVVGLGGAFAMRWLAASRRLRVA